LKNVPLLGDKTFEQCAGFMRIMEGDHPLDRFCVHPEAYPVVERILAHTKVGIRKLIGNSHLLDKIVVSEFIDKKFSEVAVFDIIEELKKPGRDPRPEFKTALFKDGVATDWHLMHLGQFAVSGVGVHQDGLVHISQLADGFVKDPQKVVKSGEVVRVKVQEIDLSRKRISLTIKMGEVHARPVGKEKQAKKQKPRLKHQERSKHKSKIKAHGSTDISSLTALAEAFNKTQK
jgi:uncharacterized protein